MKSKLTLMLMAAVGSTALVASAQTQQPPPPARNTFVPADYPKTDYVPVPVVRSAQPFTFADVPQPPAPPQMVPPGPNVGAGSHSPYATTMYFNASGWGGRGTS